MAGVTKQAIDKALSDKDWRAFLRQFGRNLRSYGEKEARRIWREEYGLIYVKTYTVKAHFYKRRDRAEKT